MNDTPPEVALAQFILRDEGFFPGDDLNSLVSRFATVEFTHIPFRADGISIKLKSGTQRPHIIVNTDNPPTRQKFTLAHELGHVLIPWHIGNICSHVGSSPEFESEYYQQEREADRFASELLVPTQWVSSLFGKNSNPAQTLDEILSTVKVSPQAATIKLMQCLPAGFICSEQGPRAQAQYYRSPGTITSAPYEADHEQLQRYDKLADAHFSLKSDRYQYCWWFFSHDHEIPGESINRPWKDVLADILRGVPGPERFHVQQSLNGILSFASSRSSIEDAYNYAMTRIKGNDYAPHVIEHPDFRLFLTTRLKELRSRKKL